MNRKIVVASMLALMCATGASAKKPEVKRAAGNELFFMENKGQVKDQHDAARPDIDYWLKGGNIDIYIGKGELHYQFIEVTNAEEIRKFDEGRAKNRVIKGHEHDESPSPHLNTYRMDVELVGANKNARVEVAGGKEYFERYYLPGCENGEVAHAFTKLTYKEVYPNIDWVVYTKGSELEYEFVVRPGGDPSAIKLKYGGAKAIDILKDGSLKLQCPLGTIMEKAPFSYQADGKVVSSSYRLQDSVLSFNVGEYTGTLVIDPTLAWGTYYGISSYYEYGWGNDVSPSGMVYMTGYTSGGSGLATSGTFQTSLNSSYDAYMVKFDNAGQRLWATYYGGYSDEYDTRIDVDGSHNIYMTGYTNSSSVIASSGAHQTSYFNGTDAYLVKFDSTGNRLWGTYYGGSSYDYGRDVSADASGDVYLVGETQSSNNIASGGHQNSISNTSYSDGFLVKFNSSGVRQWATYYGGTYPESFFSVATDPNGDVYIGGYSYSSNNITTSGAHQTTSYTQSCGYCYPSAALIKFNSSGTRQWGTYYGGYYSSSHLGYDVACDRFGNVLFSGYVNGATSNTSIATSGAYQTTAGNTDEGFVAKFNSSGTRTWGTFYGGSSTDYVYAVTTDQFGNVIIGGSTYSSNGIASTTGAVQSNLSSGPDFFIAKLDSNGANRLWGTYYGGTATDEIQWSGLSVDTASYSIYASGYSYSGGLGTTGTYQPNHSNANSYSDALLVRINDCPIPAQPASINGGASVCSGSSQTYSVTAVSGATSYTWTLPNGWTGTSTTNSITATVGTTGGNVTVTANVSCGSSTPQTLAVTVNANPVATATAAGTTTFCQGGSVVINANTGTGLSYQWKLNGTNITGATGSSYTATANGNHTVVVTNTSGCSDTSSQVAVTVLAAPNATATPATSTTFCQGGNVVINATTGTGLTYQWQDNGTNITGATGNSYTATATGNYSVIITNTNSCSDTSSVVAVTVNPLPSANISTGGSTSICAGSSIALTGTPGVGLSYQWKLNGSNIFGATAPVYSATAAGTYTLVVTNSYGCSATSTGVSVTVVAVPTAYIIPAGTTNICQGNTVALAANIGTGLTYQWQFNGANIAGATSASYSAAAAGSYTVIVTNTSNCSAVSAAIPVTVMTTPVATVTAGGPTTFCTGGNVTLSANTGTGLNYQWLNNGNVIPGAIGTSYTANTSGSYSVVVSNGNNCADTSSILAVVVVPAPAVTGTTFTNPTSCPGTNGIITLSGLVSGGTYNVSYLVNGTPQTASVIANTSGNISITGLTQATYSNIVVAVSGCSSTAVGPVILSNPVPQLTSVTSNSPVCLGDTLELGVNNMNGASFSWTGPGSFTSNVQNPEILNYASVNAGTYSVTAVLNGCTSNTLTVNVTTAPVTTQPGAITGAVAVCEGSSQIYSIAAVNNATSYTWTFPGGWSAAGTANSITATAGPVGGNITVTADNACGSSAPQTIAVVVDTVSATTTPAVSAQVCDGDSIALTAGSGTGYTYQWQFNGTDLAGETNTVLQASAGGNYSVIVTSANTCKDTSDVVAVTVNPLPVPVISLSGVNQLSTTSFTSYQWNLNGNAVAGATAQDHTATQDGSYTVTVTDANGCSNTSAPQVLSQVSVNGLVKVRSTLTLYPNPNAGSFILKGTILATGQTAEAVVTDIAGRVVLREQLAIRNGVIEQQFNLDGSVSAGVYMIKIVSDTEAQVISFVKK
jgi:hypothetical protein